MTDPTPSSAERHVERALESDAPLSAAVHQRDVGKVAAEARQWSEAAVVGRVTARRRSARAFVGPRRSAKAHKAFKLEHFVPNRGPLRWRRSRA